MMYYKGTHLKQYERDKEYQIDDTSRIHLIDLGFRYKPGMSDAEDDVLEYSFPVYRYHMSISLECRFLLWQQSNILKVDIFDTTTHGIYGPWYYDNSGIHQDMLEIINRNIGREMKRLGITERC